MAVRVVMNQDGINALLSDPGVIAKLGEVTEEGAQIARDIAPVRSSAYRDDIEPWVGVVDGKAMGRILAKDFKSWWIEMGTAPSRTRPVGTPAYRVLGRTVDRLRGG